MNGYSCEVKRWSTEKLRCEYSRLSTGAKYTGPAHDIHWLYRAVLEELKNRWVKKGVNHETD